MEKVKGLSQKNPHRHRQQYGDDQRERGMGEVEDSKAEINGDGRRLGVVNTQYNIQRIY